MYSVIRFHDLESATSSHLYISKESFDMFINKFYNFVESVMYKLICSSPWPFSSICLQPSVYVFNRQA